MQLASQGIIQSVGEVQVAHTVLSHTKQDPVGLTYLPTTQLVQFVADPLHVTHSVVSQSKQTQLSAYLPSIQPVQLVA